jgi:hypothetical protein
MTPMGLSAKGIGVGVVVLGLAGCEWATWRASREAIPADRRDSRRIEPGEAVVVLGFPAPVLHRWRVRIAVRSTDPATARFVFTGAPKWGPRSEAQMMADYAVRVLGVPGDNVVVEEGATTTVENIANSIPLIDDAPAIKIASDTFHARRGRRVLADQSPRLARRLVRTRDYLPGEWGLLHAVMAAWQLGRTLRARRRT